MSYFARMFILALICAGLLFTPGCACINSLMGLLPFGLLSVQATPDGENQIIETGQKVMFTEGLAAVCINGRWGYIDTAGAWVIPPRYECASAFCGGSAEVFVGGNYRIIDRAGTILGPSSKHYATLASACPAD